ncbi:MAG: hypothetical protein IPH07_23760 [Deltaproteobacteria bacterium]|nr:hypothetical protein [Deltaproteobacteria bacterium]
MTDLLLLYYCDWCHDTRLDFMADGSWRPCACVGRLDREIRGGRMLAAATLAVAYWLAPTTKENGMKEERR